MRYLRFFLLLLFSGPAFAQTPLRAPRPDTVAATPPAAAPDTAAAIHRLFKRHRQRRDLIAVGLGAGIFVGAAISSNAESRGGRQSSGGGYGNIITKPLLQFSFTDYLILYSVPAVPLILADVLFYSGFSRKKEAAAIAAWQAHRLPARLRHKLKPRYFR